MLFRSDERYTEESVERLQEAWSKFKEIKPREVIADDQLFREMRDRFGSAYGFGEYFEGGMGAAAIRQLLEDFDLEAEAASLRETIQTSRGQRHARTGNDDAKRAHGRGYDAKKQVLRYDGEHRSEINQAGDTGDFAMAQQIVPRADRQ